MMFERVTFLILLALAAGIAVKTLLRRATVVRSGRPVVESGEPQAERIRRLLRYVPGQWCNIQNISSRELAGVQHLFLFFGAACLGVYYGLFVILGDGLGFSALLYHNRLARGFVHLSEVFAVLILVGLWWGVIRRAIVKPARLGPDFEVGTFLKITLGGSILMLCLLVLEALRQNLGWVSGAGPISALLVAPLQRLLGSPAELAQAYRLLWWVQAAMLLAFIVYVPFSKHQHALFSPFNIFASSPRPKGRIDAIALDESYRGLAQPADFTWKQLLELYGCTQCGRCQDACPAYATGKPLSPKKIIQDVRRWMDSHGQIHAPWEKPLTVAAHGTLAIDSFVTQEELWSCTTCMACVEACPAFISAFDTLIDLRRHAVLAQSRIYPEVATFFRELESYADTFGKGKALREDWILGRDAVVLTPERETDLLFWVGCQATFNDRNRSGATALFDILSKAGCDFAILGRDELCCGDPLRRMGNEYLFQELARRTVAYLNQLKFKRIVTYCPHCYNMLKNEYPQFGARFEVYHYTELLGQMITDGTLPLTKALPGTVAYHDPCYLARGNRIYNQPRAILAAIPGTTLVETAHAGPRTFCCGGGGGHMWIGGSRGVRINEQRVRELAAGEAKTIVTSCPYCLVMLEDGAKSLSLDRVTCKDLVEFVRERM
jgi:Fe-S oxidoreductase